MNKRSIMKFVGVAAVAATLVGLSGCTPAGDSGDGKVTLTWWHNATSDPLAGFWQDVATEFEADHPNVTVDVQIGRAHV